MGNYVAIPLKRLFELVYLDPIHLADFLVSIDLLDHIEAVLFDLACLLHGPEYVIPTSLDDRLFELARFCAWSLIIGSHGNSESSHRQLGH